jgi:hypothetical protein
MNAIWAVKQRESERETEREGGREGGREREREISSCVFVYI